MCLLVYYVIKRLLKGLNEEPEEEAHGTRTSTVPGTGAPVPAAAGYTLLPAGIGVFMETHQAGIIDYSLHFQPLCPLWRIVYEDESPKLLIKVWSFS